MDNDTAESWRREFSVLSDHFSFETKTAMKNKVFFKMREKKKRTGHCGRKEQNPTCMKLIDNPEINLIRTK